jgi:hypothetical protein
MGKIFSAGTFLAALIAASMSVGCFCKEVPNERKLADCTTNDLQFQMICSNWPPYQILLGSPLTHDLPDFRGEIIVQQGTSVVSRILINSTNVTPCNWLDQEGLKGCILTWNRTNQLEKLSKVLVQGQTYNVRVRFEETFPPETTLWFSSMGKARW